MIPEAKDEDDDEVLPMGMTPAMQQRMKLEDSLYADTTKKETDAMELKFDYREINNSYNVVPLKVKYENQEGQSPPKINGD